MFSFPDFTLEGFTSGIDSISDSVSNFSNTWRKDTGQEVRNNYQNVQQQTVTAPPVADNKQLIKGIDNKIVLGGGIALLLGIVLITKGK